MKTLILGFVLSLATLSMSAQTRNKKYDVVFIDLTDKIKGPVGFQIGAYIRNDTLFIEPNALVNIINVHSEDSIWKPFNLAPYREKLPTKTIKGESGLKRVDYHNYPYDSTRIPPPIQNTSKKKQ